VEIISQKKGVPPGNSNGRIFAHYIICSRIIQFYPTKNFYMKPEQPTPPSISTPLLLLALLLFITCVVIGLSSCNGNQYQEEKTQTDTTAVENQIPPTPPPPIDSMGADSLNGQPVEQK
jgi:hypothetical protein